MEAGYLYIEDHAQHEGLIRLRRAETAPLPPDADDGGNIRYVARFSDLDAACMHVQNALHGRLLDPDTRVYQAGLAEVIAVVEVDELRHERIWLDPGLDNDFLDELAEKSAQRREQLRRKDRFWRTVGAVGIILLLLTMILV